MERYFLLGGHLDIVFGLDYSLEDPIEGCLFNVEATHLLLDICILRVLKVELRAEHVVLSCLFERVLKQVLAFILYLLYFILGWNRHPHVELNATSPV